MGELGFARGLLETLVQNFTIDVPGAHRLQEMGGNMVRLFPVPAGEARRIPPLIRLHEIRNVNRAGDKEGLGLHPRARAEMKIR